MLISKIIKFTEKIFDELSLKIIPVSLLFHFSTIMFSIRKLNHRMYTKRMSELFQFTKTNE